MLRYCAVLGSVFAAAHAQAAPASEATMRANAAVVLPPDAADEDFASRGFIASWPEPVLKDASGAPAWSFAAYDFVEGGAPASVNPSLWRHAKLLARHGLFRAHERIYQVRGFDVSNMSIIVGAKGLILVDPLTSVEAAQAALALARRSLGEKPVVAVIYTHSHADHFAGVKGVVDAKDVAAGRVRIIAPENFLEHAVSENIIAGPAMMRRAAYQFGTGLTPGDEGQMTSGIGRGIAGGTRSLIPPTETIRRTGQTLMIDGVRFVFQLTPNTEAPAEMNFFLPDFGALCLAENANVSMHNVLTPRGALVRDSRIWADYLTEALRLYGDRSEIMFASHGWPRFGGERVRDFMASHRDAYKYLHDQSVRMMNMGLTGEEIAERIALPASLAQRWFNRGYYGTMRHNSRAVYQRYMGWYDGNPAHLNALPHEASAARYVEAMGGAKKVMKRARRAADAGDYRWAAELLDRVVFADAENEKARAALAAAHEQLGYQAESAIWRNMYLSAARELTAGPAPASAAAISPDYIAATPSALLFDLLAVRLNPERAAVGADAGSGPQDAQLKLNLVFTDRKERFAVTVRNGVLVHEKGVTLEDADATVALARPQFLLAMLAPGSSPQAVQSATAPPAVTGDAAAWETFRTLFDAPDPNFAIVTP
jgi:alkyl sulfatase BDS1-like metallo-beta-lactamase superfamily hydrolase